MTANVCKVGLERRASKRPTSTAHILLDIMEGVNEVHRRHAAKRRLGSAFGKGHMATAPRNEAPGSELPSVLSIGVVIIGARGEGDVERHDALQAEHGPGESLTRRSDMAAPPPRAQVLPKLTVRWLQGQL